MYEIMVQEAKAYKAPMNS